MVTNSRLTLLLFGLIANAGSMFAAAVFPWPWQTRVSEVVTPLMDIVFGGGRFVAVGASGYTSGTILTSTDGTNWSRTRTGPLSAVAYGGGKFIAVGSSGQVLSSENGLNWAGQRLRSVTQFLSVTYGAGRFVAHGARVAWTSTNGQDWVEVPLPASVTRIVFGGGVFIAIGLSEERPVVLRSTDGVQWSSAISPPPERLQALAFGQDRFLAISETQSLWASSDGSMWSERPLERWLFEVGELSYAAGRFIRHGRQKLSFSADGSVWIDVPIELTFNAITHGNGLFVAVGDRGMILTSKDLVEWNSADTTAVPQGFGISSWLTHGAGRFVVVNRQRSLLPPSLSSMDGFSWKTPEVSSGEYPWAVAYGNGRFVAVGFGWVRVSSDGQVWQTFRSNLRPAGLSFSGDQFLATGPSGEILSSTNGIDWSPRISGTGNALVSAAFGPPGHVIVGANGTIVHSRDGIEWLPVNSGTGANLLRVVYGGGRYVAVGTYGYILTSPDGIQWAAQASGTTNHLWGIDYGNGYFVAVGDFRILVSTSGTQWAVASINTHRLNQVVFGNGKFLVMGNAYLIADLNQAVLQLKGIGAGQADLSIFGLAGRTYRIEATDRLDGSAWLDLGTVSLNSSEGRFSDVTAAGANRRFYRAILE